MEYLLFIDRTPDIKLLSENAIGSVPAVSERAWEGGEEWKGDIPEQWTVGSRQDCDAK